MVRHGAVKHLAAMLTAQHVLMQNEALISLMILTTTSLTDCESILLEADIGGKLCKLFTAANSLEVPILHNALSLMDNIVNSGIWTVFRIQFEIC